MPGIVLPQLDEYLADIGGAPLLEHVVVYEWRPMAQMRIPALDLVVRGEIRLDVVQCAIGLGDAGAVGRVHPDQKLRHVSAWKQAEADQGHGGADQHEHPEGAEQCLFRARQRPAQSGAVHVVNGGHDPVQQALREAVEPCQQSGGRAGRGRIAEHAAGEKRDHRERHEQRGGDGVQDRGRERTDELAGALGQEQQRQKRERQRRGAAKHGHGDLVGRLDRRLRAVHTAAYMAGDVFNDHDRVVDEQAEGHHEPGDRQLVETEAREVEQRETDRQRQRNRDHHHARGPQTQRQERDHHEADRQRKIQPQAIEPVGDIA